MNVLKFAMRMALYAMCVVMVVRNINSYGMAAAAGWMLFAIAMFALNQTEALVEKFHGMAKDAIDHIGKLSEILSGVKLCIMHEMPIDDGEQERQDGQDGQDSQKADQQPDEPKPVEPTKEDNEYEDRVQVVRDLAKCSQEALHYLTEGVDEFTCNSGGVEVKVCVKHDSGTSGQENKENENKEKNDKIGETH